MRNLKRALSLTLASVMLLGMMVVGSSAKGYDDVKETDNVEAIEVAQAIEVMVGDERGFGPDRPVNRAEMAVVMGKLLNLDYDYYATSCPFNDVYDWARGWVGACYANKIVSGRGDGIYDPGATVTAVEAASMLMRALGYFQYQNDYADGFELSTVRQGTKIRIFDGVGSSATEPMTRNQVAQMVLNALQTGMVEPDGNTINLTTPDGTVFTGKVNYVNVTSRKDFAYAISKVEATSIGSQNSGAIVELGEKLYDGKLKLDDYRVDDFGRPSRRWEYDGKEIGNYVKKELLRETYTTKVTGRMLEELLTEPTIDDYKFVITVDGETEESVLTQGDNSYFTKGNLIHSNTKAVGATDKGVLTQVFVDTDRYHEYVYIAVINTYLAKATSDYNTKKEEAYFTVYGVEDVGGKDSEILVKNTGDKDIKDKTSKTPYTERLTVENKDIAVADVKEDDLFLAHVADGEIKELIVPEILADKTIVNFKEGSYVTSDGTQTDYDDTALYDAEVLDQYDDKNLKNVTYNIILDEYGYLIGLELNEDPDQYVFITGTDGGYSNLKNKEAEMAAIFLDGTMKTITVNVKDSDDDVAKFVDMGAIVNVWCTYTVDKNGIYTLKAVPLAINNAKGEQVSKIAQWASNANGVTDGITIDKKHMSLDGSNTASFAKVYGNDDTVYLNVTTDLIVTTKADYAQQNTATGNGLTNGINGTDKNYVSTKSGNQNTAVIIDDVDSVTVGVKNVNIKVKDVVSTNYKKSDNTDYTANELALPKSEIFTLYNKDGRIIAAVTIGVDDGTSTKYAFFHSDKPIQEAYDADKDEYTWRREAIVDGQIVELREVGSNMNKLGNKASNGNIQDGDWAEVKYDADGNVRKVTEIDYCTTGTTHDADDLYFCGFSGATNHPGNGTSDSPKFLSALIGGNSGNGDVEDSVVDNDVVVLYVPITSKDGKGVPNTSITYKNGSLWLGKNAIKGFTISADVKTVLCLSELVKGGTPGDPDDVIPFDDVTDGYTGYSDLERAIDMLDSNFYGYLGVIIENGEATSIILDDRWGTEVDQGVTGGDTAGVQDAEFDGKKTVTITYTGDEKPSDIAILNAIIAELMSQPDVVRVEDVEMTSSTSFTAKMVLENGSTMRITSGVINYVSSKLSSSGEGKLENDLINDEYKYVFGGEVTMNDKTKTITFTGDYHADGTNQIPTYDGHKVTLLDDIARFLGWLYRKAGVEEITFDDENYTWNPTSAGNLKGSNWYGTDGTLVADIKAATAAAISGNGSTVDGLSFTLTLDGVDWTVAIALDS